MDLHGKVDLDAHPIADQSTVGESVPVIDIGMLEQNVYLAPSAFEAGFVSSAHGEDEISKTLQAAATVFGSL